MKWKLSSYLRMFLRPSSANGGSNLTKSLLLVLSVGLCDIVEAQWSTTIQTPFGLPIGSGLSAARSESIAGGFMVIGSFIDPDSIRLPFYVSLSYGGSVLDSRMAPQRSVWRNGPSGPILRTPSEDGLSSTATLFPSEGGDPLLTLSLEGISKTSSSILFGSDSIYVFDVDGSKLELQKRGLDGVEHWTQSYTFHVEDVIREIQNPRLTFTENTDLLLAVELDNSDPELIDLGLAWIFGGESGAGELIKADFFRVTPGVAVGVGRPRVQGNGVQATVNSIDLNRQKQFRDVRWSREHGLHSNIYTGAAASGLLFSNTSKMLVIGHRSSDFEGAEATILESSLGEGKDVSFTSSTFRLIGDGFRNLIFNGGGSRGINEFWLSGGFRTANNSTDNVHVVLDLLAPENSRALRADWENFNAIGGSISGSGLHHSVYRVRGSNIEEFVAVELRTTDSNGRPCSQGAVDNFFYSHSYTPNEVTVASEEIIKIESAFARASLITSTSESVLSNRVQVVNIQSHSTSVPWDREILCGDSTSTRRHKIGINNKAVPRDRVFLNYNFFENTPRGTLEIQSSTDLDQFGTEQLIDWPGGEGSGTIEVSGGGHLKRFFRSIFAKPDPVEKKN